MLRVAAAEWQPSPACPRRSTSSGWSSLLLHRPGSSSGSSAWRRPALASFAVATLRFPGVAYRDFLARTGDVHVLVVFLLFGLALQQVVTEGITSDGCLYFAHLRSLVFDGDLDISRELAALNLPPRPHHVVAFGAAIVWAPLYLLVWLADTVGLLRVPELEGLQGLRGPYVRAALVSSYLVASAGLLVLHRRLRAEFGAVAALATSLLLAAGTSLAWYGLYEPAMAHAASFGLAALFVVGCDRWRNRVPPVSVAVATGVLFSLLVAVRPQDGLFGIFLAATIASSVAKSGIALGPGESAAMGRRRSRAAAPGAGGHGRSADARTVLRPGRTGWLPSSPGLPLARRALLVAPWLPFVDAGCLCRRARRGFLHSARSRVGAERAGRARWHDVAEWQRRRLVGRMGLRWPAIHQHAGRVGTRTCACRSLGARTTDGGRDSPARDGARLELPVDAAVPLSTNPARCPDRLRPSGQTTTGPGDRADARDTRSRFRRTSGSPGAKACPSIDTICSRPSRSARVSRSCSTSRAAGFS